MKIWWAHAFQFTNHTYAHTFREFVSIKTDSHIDDTMKNNESNEIRGGCIPLQGGWSIRNWYISNRIYVMCVCRREDKELKRRANAMRHITHINKSSEYNWHLFNIYKAPPYMDILIAMDKLWINLTQTISDSMICHPEELALKIFPIFGIFRRENGMKSIFLALPRCNKKLSCHI